MDSKERYEIIKFNDAETTLIKDKINEQSSGKTL